MGAQATENSTGSLASTGNTTQPVFTQTYSTAWILCQATASVFTIICLYLTSAVVFHKFKVRNQTILIRGQHGFVTPTISTISNNALYNNNNNNNHKSRSRISAISSDPLQSKSRARRGMALDILIIVAAVSVTLRLFSEQLILNLSHLDKETCNIIADIHVVLYALPIAAIYSFLWLRQRILYSHPPLSLFNSRRVNVVSFAIIAVMVAGELVTALVFTLTITYKPGELGCPVDTTLLPAFAPWLMIIFFTGVFQLLLLSLYVVPMVRQGMGRNSTSGELRFHGANRVGQTVKRACAITCTCVASDLLAGLITIGFPVSVVSNLVYDLNLLVNLVGIVCSFKDWRKRLFPFCCFDKRRNFDVARPQKRHAEYTSSNESGCSGARIDNAY